MFDQMWNWYCMLCEEEGGSSQYFTPISARIGFVLYKVEADEHFFSASASGGECGSIRSLVRMSGSILRQWVKNTESEKERIIHSVICISTDMEYGLILIGLNFGIQQ